MLVRLLFASRAADATPAADAVASICAKASEHNAANGVTGVLVYGSGIFMQAIEGSRRAVSDLYALILRDQRHRDVTLLHYEEISERRFGGWTMGIVDTARLNPALLLKYGEKAELDPYAISGKASLALLDELLASACVTSAP